MHRWYTVAEAVAVQRLWMKNRGAWSDTLRRDATFCHKDDRDSDTTGGASAEDPVQLWLIRVVQLLPLSFVWVLFSFLAISSINSSLCFHYIWLLSITFLLFWLLLLSTLSSSLVFNFGNSLAASSHETYRSHILMAQWIHLHASSHCLSQTKN